MSEAAPHDAKHTPGPWEARWECSAICVGEQTLARIYWDEGRSAAENCANAYLIAAAPELKSSLLWVLRRCDDMPEIAGLLGEPEIAAICAAIAKAEGRE